MGIGIMEMPSGFKYKDIFLRGRPAPPPRRHPMPASHWAKIYAPFAALSGFDEAIDDASDKMLQKAEYEVVRESIAM